MTAVYGAVQPLSMERVIVKTSEWDLLTRNHITVKKNSQNDLSNHIAIPKDQ